MGVPRQHIRLRRALAADWLVSNPVLLAGELGYEQDGNKLKAGDGVTPWVQLPYVDAGQTEFDGTVESLSNVSAGAAIDKSILVYNSSSGNWEAGPSTALPEVLNGGNF